MRQYFVAIAIFIGLIGSASANPLTITATTGGFATGPNLNFLTFDNPGLPSAVSLNSSNALVVSGSADGFYAAPYLSNNQGAFFGESPNNGADASNYLAIEKGGSATFTFKSPQTYFGLLWGSIDSYNFLSFYDEHGDLIATLNGSDIANPADGDQGVDGTKYVNIFSDISFTTVIATSSDNAFEIDDVAYDPPSEIPEPPSLAILGIAAVLGSHIMRRKGRCQTVSCARLRFDRSRCAS